jgi:hypothetical protein
MPSTPVPRGMWRLTVEREDGLTSVLLLDALLLEISRVESTGILLHKVIEEMRSVPSRTDS